MGKSNQKTVKIRKEPCDKQHYYTMINLQALVQAAEDLDGDAFKMWVYFSKNQAGYELQLSSKHAMETFGLTKDRYNKAIHALIKNGNLVDTNTDPQEVANRWSFYEIPLVGQTDKPLQENNTSLQGQDDKPCPTEQIRNNTENTNTNKRNDSQSAPKGFNEWTDEQKKAFFSKIF